MYINYLKIENKYNMGKPALPSCVAGLSVLRTRPYSGLPFHPLLQNPY